MKADGLLKAAVVAAFLSGLGATPGRAAISAEEAKTIASLTKELDQLDAQLTRAEDTAAIKRLQRAYGYFLDKGMWEDLAQLFTDDAVGSYPAGVFVGKASLRQHFWRNVGDGDIGLKDGRLYNHMVLQPVINVAPDGKTAKGRWRVLAMIGRMAGPDGKGGQASWAGGIYENEYAKENGVWKIKNLHYYNGFAAPYEGGWAKVAPIKAADPAAPPAAPEAPRASRFKLAHPADQPRNEACDGYPKACIQPFHYPNPVSGRVTTP